MGRGRACVRENGWRACERDMGTGVFGREYWVKQYSHVKAKNRQSQFGKKYNCVFNNVSF